MQQEPSMSGRKNSWVSRRIADFEKASSDRALNSTSKPVMHRRDRHQPQKELEKKKVATSGASVGEQQRPAGNVEQLPTDPSLQHPRQADNSSDDKQQRPVASRDLTAEGRLARQVDTMARRIAELEAALAVSERRVGRLSSSAAGAAAAARRSREADQAYAALGRRCGQRVCQLEDALVQAEKRASWLQEELKLVSACGSRQLRELEGVAVAQQPAAEHKTEPSGGDCKEEWVEEFDKMAETHQALSGLRVRFYQTMRERNALKSKCDEVTTKLETRTHRCDQLVKELLRLNAPRPGVESDKAASSKRRGGTNRSESVRIVAPQQPLERAPKSSVGDRQAWHWAGAPAKAAANA